jgi:hypothetical protein
VKRLHESFTEALGTESVRGFLARNALVPFPASPEALAKFQIAESGKRGRSIRAAGTSPE